jgi:hypothetical protein
VNDKPGPQTQQMNKRWRECDKQRHRAAVCDERYRDSSPARKSDSGHWREVSLKEVAYDCFVYDVPASKGMYIIGQQQNTQKTLEALTRTIGFHMYRSK